ncbi:MAG TPA: DUF4012 domain-containing protein, partial [Candidatus Woesebacteria bacterium]|nr:DUF4012 domain-containing protein [Candidatus Woesebacteria bacterium]
MTKNRILNIIISFFSVLIIFGAISTTLLFFFIYVPGKKLYQQSKILISESDKIKTAISNKDLKELNIQIDSFSSKLKLLDKQFRYFSFAKNLPYAKDYYADGDKLFKIAFLGIDTSKILIQAVEPYQDFLGLKGGKTDSTQTTQDRITFLTQSIEGVLPHLDTIEKNLAEINTQLSQIDADRYPETIKNYQVKSNIIKAQALVSDSYKLLKDGKPILTKTSWLLGKDKPRNYLLLFQNDAELRPTGGFWTAFSVIQVDKGKVNPIFSDDIYALDSKINSTIPAPRPIKSYHINVPYWNVRDMNLSPDFPTSVKLFLDNYYKAYGKKNQVDAVIAIDTQVLVDLVSVLGKIGVGDPYGSFEATPDKRCDGCPQIIYQLEWIAGRPRNYIETNRKGFLGPLMRSILANAMGAEKSKIGPLAQAAFKDIFEKHILFYFSDETMQQAADLANINGKIVTTDSNTDYFHLNDANMSSAKTNLFIRQKIKHEIISKDGSIEHKVSITYTNP